MRRAWLLMVAAALTPGAVKAQGAPLTLEQATGIAIQRSRDVQGARLEVTGAEQRVREAWGSVMPTIDLTASYTRNLTVPGTFLPGIFFDPEADPDQLVAVKFGSDNMWNMQVRAEQPLFQGSAFIGVGAASQYEALQREVLRGRAQTVVTRVRVAYFDALLAQEAVRLTENTVRRIRQTLDEMKKMERAGVASNYDVLRLEVELANVEPALRRARNSARSALRALAVELGMEQLDGVELAGSLSAMNVDSLIAAPVDTTAATWREAVAHARSQRSELRQLELTERLRRAEMRAEMSDYLPKLSLFGTYSINAQQSGNPAFFGETEAQRAYGRQVGLQLTLPLFNGMKRPARVSQKQVEIEKVRTQRDLAEDQVETQVRTFVDQLAESRERVIGQRAGVQLAQRGYDIAAAQYREGLSSALELTDAEVALRQSEFNFAEAVYDYLVARARLDDAMGTVDIERHVEDDVASQEAR